MWLFDLPNSKTVWIQHETGLEILTIAAEIARVARLLYKVYEAIRKRVRKNTESENTDRHCKRVDKIRVEVRRLDASGNLEQQLWDRVRKRVGPTRFGFTTCVTRTRAGARSKRSRYAIAR